MDTINWNKYPYTDFHEMNLDFVLNTMSEIQSKLDGFVEYNEIKFHDPIEWNIETQYTRNTIITNQGVAYLSKAPVPSGIAISDRNYWLPIGIFNVNIDTFKQNLTVYNEGASITASRAYVVGDIIWWNDYLYYVTSPIYTGDTLNESNLVKTNMLDEFKKDRQALANEISARELADSNEVTARELAISNEVTARNNAIAAIKISDLYDVNADAPQNGQILKYNATNNVWYNANESGGGGGSVDIDNVTIVKNSFDQLKVADDITDKVDLIDISTSISSALALKANAAALDEWHTYGGSIEAITVSNADTDTDIIFHSIDSTGRYELWFETPDGSQAITNSSSYDGVAGTLTYNVKVATVPSYFMLRTIK